MNTKFHTYIDLKIFPNKTLVFLNYKNDDKADIYKVLSRKIKTKSKLLELVGQIDKEDIGNKYGLCFENGGWNVVVLNKFVENDAECIATLTHELAHVVFNLARHIGLVHSSDSEEFFTYIQDYYLFTILKEYKKHVSNQSGKHRTVSTGKSKKNK